MKDGLIQVTDDNLDDILDSTFDILIVFCDKVVIGVALTSRRFRSA